MGMLSNNKVKNNDPLEIKTIDFSLVNMGEHISTPNTTLLDSKIDLLENKIEEQIQTNQVIMKKLNFDNMFNEKVDTIEEEVVNIKKNINELNKKLEEAELIRQIIEESISTILDAKLNEKTETSNDINKNILEVDLIVKENRMEINNLKQNLKILVNNEIELSIENKVNNIISNVVNDKINILLEENNKKILDSVNEMIKNEHKEDSSKEEKTQRILEEEKKKEEAKRILEEEKKKEEEEAKRILEEEKKKEEEKTKEEEKKKEEEKEEEEKKKEEAKRILEEEKEEEEAKRILEEE